jgi:hypothetical protein
MDRQHCFHGLDFHKHDFLHTKVDAVRGIDFESIVDDRNGEFRFKEKAGRGTRF